MEDTTRNLARKGNSTLERGRARIQMATSTDKPKNATSATSIRPVETLKGMFSVPKMDRSRRNFLKENKLSLRELERVTSKNRITQQLEQQQREQKYLNKRSISQQRGQIAELKAKPVARFPSCSRVSNNQAGGDGGDGIRSVTNNNNGYGRSSRRCITNTASSTTILSCDKEIQTEDIRDEKFLYDALKKCESRTNGLQQGITRRSHAFGSVLKNSEHQIDPEIKHLPYAQEMEEAEQLPLESNTHQFETDQFQQVEDDAEPNYLQEQQSHMDAASKYNFPPSSHPQQYSPHGYNENGNNVIPQYEPENQYDHGRTLQQNAPHEAMHDDVRSNFDNLSLRNNGCDVDAPQQQSHSGRSNRTNFSHSTQQYVYEPIQKRSTGSVHKLGCRDDLRLPRYLEREKREKEEQRQREKERDTNCPDGHYALPDNERKAALQNAEIRFQTLVGELNRMPMTSETLRMRKRKAEIEKELKLLETDIRIFSKQKVYVKHQE